MKDDELFELCKEVYEKTGWDGTNQFYFCNNVREVVSEFEYIDNNSNHRFDKKFDTPLYTSDYLLEKLPKEIDGYPLQLASYGGWTAKLTYDTHDAIAHYQGVSDTPLKALLKLTLALHASGELK